MTEREAEMNGWLSVIKAEFHEMPGLQLTKAQIRRLWGLDASACDAVIAALQSTEFLRVTPRGSYALANRVADATRPAVGPR